MKKLTLLLLSLLCLCPSYAQFVLTPNGLVSEQQPDQPYLIVEVADRSACELYTSTLLFIGGYFASPKEVTSTVENRMITIHCVMKEAIDYYRGAKNPKMDLNITMPIEYRDGQVKIHAPRVNSITGAPMTLQEIAIRAGALRESDRFITPIELNSIYRRNERIRLKRVKLSLELTINNLVGELTNYLNTPQPSRW